MRKMLGVTLMVLISFVAHAETFVYRDFDDWRLFCDGKPKPPLRPSIDDCWMTGSVQEARNKRHWVDVQFAILFAEKYVMSVRVPNLPVGQMDIALFVDGTYFHSAKVIECVDDVCRANIELSSSNIEKLTKALQLTVKFRVTRSGLLELSIGLKRFQAAISELRALPPSVPQ